METGHPGLQAAVIGIHVLDMEGALGAALLPQVQPMVGNAFGLGKAVVDRGTVGTQDRVWVEQRLQCRAHMRSIEFLQVEVRMPPTSVTHNQHRDLLGGKAAAACRAAALAGWTRQLALALERFQEKGLVSLDDPGLVLRTMLGNETKKAVAPTKGRVLVHVTVGGRIAHCQAPGQRLGITSPELTMAQTCHWRTGQGITGTPAGPASVARQTMAGAPGPQGFYLTARALLGWRQRLLQHTVRAREQRPQLLLLRRVELIESG
ncbi:hypothetical protein D3C78_813730 [compost metagenome]